MSLLLKQATYKIAHKMEVEWLNISIQFHKQSLIVVPLN